MKTPLNFHLSVVLMVLFSCFLFINAGCAIEETDALTPEKTATTPDLSNQKKGQISYLPIELFIYWSFLEDYQECKMSQNNNCKVEYNSMVFAEKVARGVLPFPPPPPPNPCAPIGHCPDFSFLKMMAYKNTEKYGIVAYSIQTNKKLAFNNPSKWYPSNENKNYIHTDVTILDGGFTGDVRIEMENLNTKEKYTFDTVFK